MRRASAIKNMARRCWIILLMVLGKAQAQTMWDPATFVAFGAYVTTSPYASQYSATGVCQMWTDVCRSQSKMSTDVQFYDASGKPAFNNVSLQMRAHNASCSSIVNNSNFQFNPMLDLGVMPNELWGQLIGPVASSTVQSQYSFLAPFRPNSIMVHDPLTDQPMFCCDLRYLTDPTCSGRKLACGANCSVILIALFLFGSTVCSFAVASYLHQYAKTNSYSPMAEDVELGNSGGPLKAIAPHMVEQEIKAELKSTPSLQPAARQESIKSNGYDTHPKSEVKSSSIQDDVLAAMDSIKELELLSQINDLEHELRTVDVQNDKKIAQSYSVRSTN